MDTQEFSQKESHDPFAPPCFPSTLDDQASVFCLGNKQTNNSNLTSQHGNREVTRSSRSQIDHYPLHPYAHPYAKRHPLAENYAGTHARRSKTGHKKATCLPQHIPNKHDSSAFFLPLNLSSPPLVALGDPKRLSTHTLHPMHKHDSTARYARGSCLLFELLRHGPPFRARDRQIVAVRSGWGP